MVTHVSVVVLVEAVGSVLHAYKWYCALESVCSEKGLEDGQRTLFAGVCGALTLVVETRHQLIIITRAGTKKHEFLKVSSLWCIE